MQTPLDGPAEHTHARMVTYTRHTGAAAAPGEHQRGETAREAGLYINLFGNRLCEQEQGSRVQWPAEGAGVECWDCLEEGTSTTSDGACGQPSESAMGSTGAGSGDVPNRLLLTWFSGGVHDHWEQVGCSGVWCLNTRRGRMRDASEAQDPPLQPQTSSTAGDPTDRPLTQPIFTLETFENTLY